MNRVLRLRLAPRAALTAPRFSSSHAHDSHAHPAPGEESTVESRPTPPAASPAHPAGFSAPIWRNGVLGALALVLYYRLVPSSAVRNADGELEVPEHPITKYLAYNMPEAGLWKARNAKHLDLAKEAADDKLLFQEAERPKIRRIRYTGSVSLQPGPDWTD